MRTVRFYCECIEPSCVLDPIESNHASRVLRLPVGAPVEVFDGKGTLAEGTIEQSERGKVVIKATRITKTPPSERPKIILAVSFAKGQRFDWLVEKCTELGVDHIAAVQFERTVKLGKAETVQRLSKITISAAKQSGRLFLPTLTGPARPNETISLLQSEYPENMLIYGSPDGQVFSQLSQLPRPENIIVLIGPEGGFTEQEIASFGDLKARPVCIHPNILRVETAAVAFCSLLSQAYTS